MTPLPPMGTDEGEAVGGSDLALGELHDDGAARVEGLEYCGLELST
jgi:hypothetical protein